jgi:hypothetical protein
VGEDDLAVGSFRLEAGEFTDEIGVAEAMEAEAAEALIEKLSGDREEFGDVGKVSMEGGIEAGDVEGVGELGAKSLDERDFSREVGRIKGDGVAEFGEKLLRYGLVIGVREAAVDDPVGHGVDFLNTVFEPIEEKVGGLQMVGGLEIG